MSLIKEYQRQYAWRDWDAALELCPLEPGHRVLDLGCAVGDLSEELEKRGALVTGVDLDEDLLAVARARGLEATFVEQDLRTLDLERGAYDGIWSSFVPAYLFDLKTVLGQWASLLKPGGWMCLTEIDDLLGHEPLKGALRTRLEGFYGHAFAQERYDFQAGRKLSTILKDLGLEVREQLLSDQELTFRGPASPEVLRAWEARLDRMGGLKNFFGSGFDEFRGAFLSSINSPNHLSRCRVFCVVGIRI